MNKPRLINVNELLKRMCEMNCGERQCRDAWDRCMWYHYIEDSPTAYDIESVVEQLEELETYRQTVTMEKHPFCVSEIETVSKKKAIEIVKGNYSENPNSSKGGAE